MRWGPGNAALPATFRQPVAPSAPGLSLLTFLGIVAFHTLFYVAFFSPVWLQGRRLVSGDAFAFHYPAYWGGHDLWEPGGLGGFPKFADPQFQLWYPPALLLSLLGLPFDVFVVLAYILAGTFAHALLRRLTGSWTAGCVSGLVYGTCGFLFAHQGHTAVIHVAAWLPLLLWTLEELRQTVRLVWVSALALAVGCCILGGHSQVTALCLVLTALYFLHLVPGAPAGLIRFSLAVVSGVFLGVLLSLIQILPTYELAQKSFRYRPDYAFFCSNSLPLSMLPTLLFPYAFGRFWWPGQPRQADMTEFNLAEILGASTMFALVAIFVMLWCGVRERRGWFWLVILLVAILAALGDRGPFARLLFQVPIWNKFRCPGRFVLWYGLGCACLSGFAVHQLLQLPRQRAWRVACAGLTLALLVAGVVLLGYRLLQDRPIFDSRYMAAYPLDSPFRSWRPWVNPALGIPLLCLVLSGTSLISLSVFRSWWSKGLLLTCVLLDGGSFAWLWDWQDCSLPAERLQPPAALREIRETARQQHTRLFCEGHGLGSTWIAPNLNCLVGLENVNLYTPLFSERFAHLMAAPPRVLEQVLAIGLWSGPVVRTPFGTFAADPFSQEGISGPDWSPGHETLHLQVPDLAVSKLIVVSHLLNGVDIEQGTPVVEILVRRRDGTTVRTEMQAGRDTADAELDRADLAALARHRPAPRFSSSVLNSRNHPFLKQLYVSNLKIEYEVPAQEIILRWIGPKNAGCYLVSMCLEGPDGQQMPYLSFAGNSQQGPATPWSDGNLWFARPRTAPPRAWLVPEAVPTPAAVAFRALVEQRLPDGQPCDIYRTALVEDIPEPIRYPRDANATISITERTPQRVTVQTSCAHGAFLVLADAWYPGWTVQVDGQAARLLRANYLIRAVELPPGEHQVEFVFRPRSFLVGLTISLSALVVVGLLPLGSLVRRRGLARIPPQPSWEVRSGLDTGLIPSKEHGFHPRLR